MTDEEKVANGRNSRASQQIRSFDIETVNITEKHEPLIKTAEEKLQNVSGSLLQSPDIEPSIYQADVVEDAATTTTAPTEGAAPADTPAEDAPVAEPATEAAPTEEKPPEMEAPAGESAPEASQGQMDADQGGEKKPDDSEEKKPEMDDKGEKPADEEATKSTEADGDKPSEGTTEQTTTEPQVKDPYRIDIPLEKKINKRTKRKLWEEIEKRKPLIPKYVERHIQKYAKPPFELWGCKFRGKGSCYGCGG